MHRPVYEQDIDALDYDLSERIHQLAARLERLEKVVLLQRDIDRMKAELSDGREASRPCTPRSRRYAVLVRSPRNGCWRWLGEEMTTESALRDDPETLWEAAEPYRTGDEPAAAMELVELVTVRRWRDQR